jgi:hypothetical protein
MTIKAPGLTRLVSKIIRSSNVPEANTCLLQCRISFPKTIITTEVRQPGIDPHTGTTGYQQAICSLDGSRGIFDEFGINQEYIPSKAQILVS